MPPHTAVILHYMCPGIWVPLHFQCIDGRDIRGGRDNQDNTTVPFVLSVPGQPGQDVAEKVRLNRLLG
jgi:hypothetical protein